VSSYQVFARKYRPQTFDEVVGQEHITQTLKNAIATNRLAHAYLFVGPRGTGKTSTARILAKALNCVHGPTVTPCGECDVCREIAAGNSLDVLEIDGASNNGVEQVRELREQVRYAPTRGKYKLYIIDEVHMLSTAAFNALLKTLEEPPEHVKFLFATTDVQKVLPTILSRCQRFDLRRIPGELIAGHLQHIAAQEKIQLDPEAAMTIARGADGGLRDAESMLDQLVSFCGESIAEADVLAVFGFTAAQTVSTLCDHLLEGNASEALSVVHQQAEAGRDLSRLMADLIGHLRNLLVAKADPNRLDAIEAEVGKAEAAALRWQAGRIGMERLLDLMEQFAAAEGRMKWAPNKKLHFEIAVIKAIQTLGQATLTEVLDTLTAIKTGGELPVLPVIQKGPKGPQGPKEPAGTPPAAPAQPPAVAPATASPAPKQAPAALKPAAPASKREPAVLEPTAPASKQKTMPREESKEGGPIRPISPIGPIPIPPTEEPAPPARAATETVPVAADVWPRLLKEVRQKKPMLSSWVEAGTPLAIENGRFLIGFPPEHSFAMASLGKPGARGFLEETLLSITGNPVSLQFEERAGLAPAPLHDSPEEPPPDPMEEFKNDPIIRRALDLFKAEIQTEAGHGQ